MKRFLLLFFVVVILSSCENEETKTFYFVRHAEKILTDSTGNPDLTVEGKARAEKLIQVLNKETLDGIFSTKYIRTLNTVAPLALNRQQEVNLYRWKEQKRLLDSLKSLKGKSTYVICGHSNTLLPGIEMLGGEKPIEKIDENEYDKIFIVKVKGNDVDVEMITY